MLAMVDDKIMRATSSGQVRFLGRGRRGVLLGDDSFVLVEAS